MIQERTIGRQAANFMFIELGKFRSRLVLDRVLAKTLRGERSEKFNVGVTPTVLWSGNRYFRRGKRI